MIEDCLMTVRNVELRRYEGRADTPSSVFYTDAGLVLVLETYEAAWIGRDVAWRHGHDEPEA